MLYLGLLAVDDIEDSTASHASRTCERTSHRRQRRTVVSRAVGIIEACHYDVERHAEAVLFEGADSRKSHSVVRAYERVGQSEPRLHILLDSGFTVIRAEFAVEYASLLDGQIILSHDLAEGVETVYRLGVVHRT